MEKKKMTNKKKFWIGMASLAAVGIITATVAYFSSVHVFDPDTFATSGYSVTATKVLDTAAAEAMTPHQKLDAKVSVTNEGGIPVLARVHYYIGNDTSTPPVELPIEAVENTKWVYDLNNDNFSRNSGDNAYYYKGLLSNGQTAEHLKGITYVGTGEVTMDEKEDGNTKTITYGIIDGETLTAVVETIQATDATGVALESGTISTKSAEDLQGYWDNLGKGNLATQPTQPTPGGV